MVKNINNKPFDESTKLKLKIFGECFKVWLPVFIHDKFTKQVFIYDFFAGSGTDIDGVFGSPLILLEEAKGENKKYCSKAGKKITFIFNENIKKKNIELSKNVRNYIAGCQKENQCSKCVYEYKVKKDDFKTVFKDEKTQAILKNKAYGKFILLDQYGFKEIDKDIFLELVNSPKTDFIFFISSSFIKRFKEHPNTKIHIDTEQLNFDESYPKKCHRIIADYFKSLLPKDKEYYVHHFTIQKENKGNYYGLIFGTNHTFGMEKFLKVCWSKDRFSGESNCNINNDFEIGTLFYDESSSRKIDQIKKEIKNVILAGEIRDNISGFKYTMQKGCEPSLFTKVVKELERKEKIRRCGDLNYSSTNIHRVKIYNIQVCNNANY